MEASPQLSVIDNTEKHRFEIKVDGELAAFTAYQREEPGIYAFMHTQTRTSYAGQGLATTLIQDVLGRMRANGYAVLPYCPFVNAYLRKHPEDADLVPEAERRRFGVTFGVTS